MNKLLLVIFCSVFAMSSLHGQRLRKWLKAADSAYVVQKDYKSAIKYYQVALTYDSTLLDVKYKLANSARMYKAYDLARDYYHSVIDERKDPKAFPLAEFFLAEVYHQTATYEDQNYRKATEFYNKFISRASKVSSSDVNEKLPLARRNLDIIEEASEFQSINSYYRDTLTKFASDASIKRKERREINTAESEFSPIIWNDSILFTSIRTDFVGDRSKKQYARIFSAAIEGNSKAKEFTAFKMKKGKHIANLTFNSNYTRAYYCECDYIDKYDTRCDIFYRDIVNGIWGKAKPFPYNYPLATTTQPAIGIDKEGREMLFYATDRRRQRGLKDIFYVYLLEDGSFGDTISVKEINTIDGDEMTPFYDSRYQKLYYSTTGDFTLGGADIYSISRVKDQWRNKRNLGDVVNTSYNDAFYAISPEYDYAYLASDQPQSLEYDQELEACCYDIYRIPIYNYIVEAETFDKMSGDPITGATIKRYLKDGDEYILLDSLVNEEESLLTFTEWDLSQEYLIKVEKEGYYPIESIERFEPEPEKAESRFKIDLFLDPLVRLKVFTFSQKDSLPLDSVNVDFSEITTSIVISTIEDKVPEINSHFYPIDFDKEYAVKASRIRYVGDKHNVAYDKSKIIYEGAPIIVRDSLYLEALPDFGQLLPDNVIPMYFDNNRPLMGNVPEVPRSDHDFASLLSTYQGREGTYKRQMEAAEASLVDIARINTFFTRELVDNYTSKLTQVSDAFIKYMDNGYDITLELVGYSSPIGSSAYNFQLARRRIQCVENFLKTYANGKLKSYMDKGYLKIIKNPQGEKEVLDPELLQLLNDRRQGVYNYLSILERRVDVTLREYKLR